MTLFNKLEEKKNEIDSIRISIRNSNKYIIRFRRSEKYVNKYKKLKSDNETKLQKSLINFNHFILEIIKTDREELVLWINFHKDVIRRIEDFSNLFNQKREYTQERINCIKNVKNAWSSFIFNRKLPNTSVCADYKLVFNLKKSEINNFNNLDFNYKNEILEFEEIRQELTSLSKQLSQMDTIFDKGASWGASNEAIEKAYEDIKVIDAKYKEKENLLYSIIEKFNTKNPKIIEEWQVLHLYTCISIIDFAYTKNASRIQNDSTRLSITNDTYFLWKDVITKKTDFKISITNLLSDYDLFFNELLQFQN